MESIDFVTPTSPKSATAMFKTADVVPGHARAMTTEVWYLSLLVVIVTYLSATIGPQLSDNIKAVPFVHFFRLYSQPILLGALLATLVSLSPLNRDRAVLEPVVVLAAAGLVYVFVDLVHYGAGDGLFRAVKDFFYNKVTSSYFVLVAFFGIFGIVERRAGGSRACRALLIVATASAFMSLVLWGIARLGLHTFAQLEVTNNNQQAYESSGMLLLLLFVAVRWFPALVASAIVVVHGLVPLFHHSRGGMLVSVCVLSGFLLFRTREAGWRSILRGGLERVTVGVAALLLAGFLGVFKPASPAVTVTGQPSLMTQLSQLTESPELKLNFDSNREVSPSDDAVSAYSRIGTTILAAKAFARSPFIGIGIWNAYTDIEVANFGIHGLWPLLLAGYGVLGLIPAAALLTVLWRNRGTEWARTICIILVLLLVGIFDNRYSFWLASILWGFSNKQA